MTTSHSAATALAPTTTTHPIPDQHGVNLFDSDTELQALLPLYLPRPLLDHLLPHLQRLGGLAGGVLDTLALAADKHPPTLAQRSRSGLDTQRIDKHPAYVELERVAFSDYGLAAMSHRAGVLGWEAPMPAAAKYALSYLFVQAEFGLCCPLSMTDSLSRTLRKFGDEALVARYLPQLTTQVFDELAQGAMFMTEQGAGSDVAATETRAVPQAGASTPAPGASTPAPGASTPAPGASTPAPGASTPAPGVIATAAHAGLAHRLWGDKWFCSNPDAALAMVLAHVEGGPPGMKGLSLFLLPRTLEDGSPNAYRIVRLKDKLGTRSMASGEIRFEGALAYRVGEPGRGFQQMADMINNSRLSNGMRAAGLMRRACSEAFFVAGQRQAFGRRLIDLPLMRRQLLKILLPTEQARSMLFQTAEALRRADEGDANAAALARILTPLIKFRACRDARRVTGDAMEVRGGCGYIEEWSDARLLRDAHLGSIWEGTSNIVALDVLRAIAREAALPALGVHLGALLAATQLHPQARSVFEQALQRGLATAQRVADARGADDQVARQVASALYHLTTAVAMAWEAAQTGNPRRMRLAQCVLLRRVLPADPLLIEAEPEWLPGLLQPAGAGNGVGVGVGVGVGARAGAAADDKVDAINLF